MKNGCALVLVPVGILLLVASLMPTDDDGLPQGEDVSNVVLTPMPAENWKAPEEVFANWVVTSRSDPLSGKDYPYAFVRSKDVARLGPPYGDVGLTIEVWEHPREGRNLLFVADDGQMVCGVYNCEGEISFDGKVEPLTLLRADDNSSKYLFAKYPDAILRKMNLAKKTVVRLTFYRNGSPSFAFGPAPLNWVN